MEGAGGGVQAPWGEKKKAEGGWAKRGTNTLLKHVTDLNLTLEGVSPTAVPLIIRWGVKGKGSGRRHQVNALIEQVQRGCLCTLLGERLCLGLSKSRKQKSGCLVMGKTRQTPVRPKGRIKPPSKPALLLQLSMNPLHKHDFAHKPKWTWPQASPDDAHLPCKIKALFHKTKPYPKTSPLPEQWADSNGPDSVFSLDGV